MKKKLLIYSLLISLLCLGAPLPVQAQDDNPALVEEIKDILWEHYVEPVPYYLLLQTTVEDVLKMLNDPYTKYFTDEEFQDFWFSLEGKFGGIGVIIELIDNNVVVTGVIKNTPADRVSILKGDIITHVDNKSLKNMDMDAVKDLFHGKAGSYLKLRTYRPSTASYLSYLLTREDIVIHPVEANILAKNIGYIKLLDFNQEAAQEFAGQVAAFREQGVKGLILDLRDNPGGLIGAALDISREVLPPGPFLKLYYRGEKPELITTVGNNDLLPLIVLVNEETASAAEILAGAIQDRHAGIIIGTKTYGKATVQSLVPLVNGGALKFTSGKYLTPNDRQINKIGLTPDFYITDTHDQILEAIWMMNNKVHKSVTFQAGNEVYIINGIRYKTTVKPYLSKGNFMVPLRSVTESLGGKVRYVPPGKIQITLAEDTINLNLGSSYFTYNGQARYFKTRPVMRNQSAVIPLRTIAELLGAKVEWRASTGQVIISR
ncbi:MAG: S41 family peptidase [Peptococcaceae bacterium]